MTTSATVVVYQVIQKKKNPISQASLIERLLRFLDLVLSIGQTGLIQYQPIDYYFQKQNPNAKYTRLHSSSSAQNLKLSECSKFALAMPTGGEVVTPPLVSTTAGTHV